MIKKCEICNKQFETIKNGHTRKYCYECSPSEKSGMTHNEIILHKRRIMKNKLVQLKGGCCQICGYKKSIWALQFHHLNPTEKDFQLFKSCKDFNKLKQEAEKCILVCANCHAELHEKLFNEKNINNNEFNP